MSPSRGVTEQDENDWLFPEWARFAREKLLGNNDERDGVDFEAEDDGPFAKEKATTIAACFLLDYEAGRPPTLSTSFQRISDYQLKLYQVEFSTWWRWLGLYPATVFMFVAYFQSRLWTTILHFHAVVIFLIDLYLRQRLFGNMPITNEQRKTERHVYRATFVFLVVLGIQSWMWFLLAHPEEHFSTLLASLFKPLILFYLSRRARDALEALIKIGKILARVIIIELFLILTFAAVACRLYYDDEGFSSLAVSWLSLFQLSTTVVNPSLWMPTYSNGRINAIFFVVFIVVCVFYLHSLILSVVFQVFIQAATEVHHRSAVDKEDAIRYAFLVLSATRMAKQTPGKVHVDIIREALTKVRPHYGELKLNILMELVDPLKKESLDYSTFRTTIREALNSSIRSSRNTSIFSSAVEMLSVVVTIVNFLFVTLLTSQFQAKWFITSVVAVGSLITLFCILELAMRCNICTMTYYPMTRLIAVFDSFAAAGAVVSCYGICAYFFAGNDENALDYLFTGRAIDMIRTMRFFPMFRDVVERSVNVLPALEGPVFLVLTTVHVFVYFGMALWGGQVDVDDMSQNENLEALYYLNNFNSYSEGLVTIFNVLVINDWHQIAKVFLYADRNSQAYVVYPYFVVVVLIAVCIMLNVITAFFVETFVTRLNKDDMENSGVITLQKAPAEFSVMTPKRPSMPRILSRQLSWPSFMGEDTVPPIRANGESASSDSGEVVQFDVFERQGFDRIMQTMGNSTSDQEEIAKCICETLQTVSSLSCDRNEAEFLVCCQPSMSQFHTQRFRETVSEFFDDYSLHSFVGDLTNELASRVTADNNITEQPSTRLIRQYLHPSQASVMLDLQVMTLPHVPNLFLFIARRRSNAQ